MFSEILAIANARSIATGVFSVGGSWAVKFTPPVKIKFTAIVKGACWLRFDGDEPIRLEPGELVLTSAQPRGFLLASDLRAKPKPAETALPKYREKAAREGAGIDHVLVGARLELDPANSGLLLDVLPPLIHVRAHAPQAASIRWLIDALVREQSSDEPGAQAASAQLAQLIFVHVLRAHLAAAGTLGVGWLRALRDPRVLPALRLMHGDPARAWKVEELAKAAAMSRTSFATHFKEVTGTSPLDYLIDWRMRIAKKALREDSTSVAALAQSLGYGSESAFSNAFRRVTGSAPSHYRSQARELASD